MSKLVTAIFHSRAAAEMAVDELTRAGFAPEDVSLLMSESTRGRIRREEADQGSRGRGHGRDGGAAWLARWRPAWPRLDLRRFPASPWSPRPLVAALAGLGAGAAAGGLTEH